MCLQRKKVSVIINTHNRAWHIKRLIDSLANQTYENFEIIVVNGPSDDNTNDILSIYKNVIRIESCPVVNLCISRNIGIAASAGDIVAFIDDDAVPCDKYWIENAVSFFEDETTGAVGGDSKRINGDIEFSCGYFNVIGENFVIGKPNQNYNSPKGEYYNRVVGCNAFFLRDALVEIGGFDEYYAYYLDETDVCLRLINNGYKILHHPYSHVYHEAAKGANRKSQFHLNWNVISRSLGYFIIKATDEMNLSKNERIEKAKSSPIFLGWLKDFEYMLEANNITKQDYKEFVLAANKGLEEGIRDGFKLERKLNFNISLNSKQFAVFDKSISDNFLDIVMLSENDVVTPIGGCSVYTKMLAEGFIKKGHNVHIISKGELAVLNNIEGINYYLIVPEHLSISELDDYPNCHRITDFSYACYDKIKQLHQIFTIDIIETPLWDTYGLVSAHLSPIPIITRLETPLKIVIETFGKEIDADLSLLLAYEKSLLMHSDGVIAISDNIKNTIEELYSIKFAQPIIKNYLGINPDKIISGTRKIDDQKIIIFFIGRLERRKGMDSIIKSIPYILENYPNVEFHIAGDDDIYDEQIHDTYKNKFLKENKGKNWLKKVIFMGKIADKAKEQEFADCDIFISPSLYESFGIIFIEAMRHKKPVIGCNTGGMPEIIEDRVTGLLCEPGDSKDFTDKLEVLVKDKSMREKMGTAGYNRLEKEFTDDIMCEHTLKFYKDIISMKKNICKSKSSNSI